MKKRSALIFGLPAALLALSMVVAGCDTATSPAGGGWTAGGNLIGTWSRERYTIACAAGTLTVSGSDRTSSGTWSSGTITFVKSNNGDTVSGTYYLNANGSKMKITGLTSTVADWNDQEWTKQ